MEKLKIAFLYSASSFGGIVRNLGFIVNGFDPDKFELHLILISDVENPESAPPIKSSAVSFLRVHSAGRFDMQTINKLAAYLKSNQVSVLSCHGYKADVIGWILRYLCRIPVRLVTIAHGWVTPGLALQMYYILDKIVIRFFDRLIFVSKQQLVSNRWWFFPKHKVAVVNNAIDCDSFLGSSESREEIRLLHGFEANDCVLGFVGRISAEKNALAIVSSLKRLRDRGHNLKALIVGDGPQLELLRQTVRDLGLEASVAFPGYVSATLPMYQAMDIFVTCSRKEGLPNSLLEAQAAGLPCVASRIGGHTDVIVDNETGLLFAVDDPGELDRKIAGLQNRPELREKIGQNGQQRVRYKFSLRERIRKLERLYWQLRPKRSDLEASPLDEV